MWVGSVGGASVYEFETLSQIHSTIKRKSLAGKQKSGFVEGRYDYLIIYDVVDDRNKLKRVSDKEVMLYRKDAPMIKVNSVSKKRLGAVRDRAKRAA